MDGLAPGLGSVRGSPDPLYGHTSRLCLFGECCFSSFCWIWFLGWGIRSWGDISHFLGGSLHVDPFVGVRCTGLVMGTVWDLSLGHHTGDGKFDG
jgi:hypothetical protein